MKLRILIQPFEQRNGDIGWDGEGADYLWGALAVALGRHYDNYDDYDDSDECSETLDGLEENLVELASETLGHSVGLAPEYI